jgi:MFS family permease
MWLTASIFYFYQFFLQVSPSVMTKNLMNAFNINAAGLGLLASVYLYAYAFTQILVGVLFDKYGVRKLLTMAAILCGIGAFIFAASNSMPIACSGRFLIGFGSAFGTIGCMFIAATWLPLRWFSLLTGLFLTIGMSGAICGQAPLALLVAKLGWRNSMYILAGSGILIATAIYIIIRDRKKPGPTQVSNTEAKLLDGLKSVMSSKQNWLCGVYCSLMYTPTLVFGTLWGVPFIIAKYQASKPFAATIVSAVFLGWAIGAPMFGWFSDHFKKRKIFLLIGSLGALISIGTAIYIPTWIPYYLTSIAVFMFGFFSSSLIIGYSVVREINSPVNTGSAIGLLNCMNMLGAAILQPIVGAILDHYYIHTTGRTSYEIALTTLPIIFIIALSLLSAIKETNARANY